jgi:oligopeptide/dipeptide ABC transporter ATP-binding protein
MMPLLEIDKVSVHFRVRGGFLRSPLTLRAVSDVSLHMSRGETLALVGESGSGKSTLGRSIAGLQRPTRGRIHLNFSRRRRGAPVQMIFQNPFSALDPRMTVEEIVAEPLILAGGDKKNRKERVVEALEQIGMPADAATRYPHEFSGGQCQRIAIARALIGKPELIVADEPLSALDVSIQSKVLNLLGDIRARFGIGYFFISHDFGAVRHLADRIAVLYCGRIMEIARADDMFGTPSHPYTQALLAAIPQIRHGRRKRRCVTRGDISPPLALPSGCVFHPRCPRATALCSTETPRLEPAPGRPDQLSACHYRD